MLIKLFDYRCVEINRGVDVFVRSMEVDEWTSANEMASSETAKTLEKSLKSKVNGRNVSPHFFVRILRKKTKF